MSTPTKITVTQTSGGPQNGAPPVETVKVAGGLPPTLREAKEQRRAQVELDTTVVAAKSGEGNSRLPIDELREHEASQKKLRGAKAEAKVEKPANKQAEADVPDEAVERTRLANASTARERAKDKQLKEAQTAMRELEQHGVKAKELQELVNTGKTEPLKAVARLLGIPDKDVVEFLAQTVLNGGKPARTPEQEKLSEMEQKMAEFEAQQQEAVQTAERQAEHQKKVAAMSDYLSRVGAAMQAGTEEDPTKHELSAIKAQQPSSDSRFKNAASEDAWNIAESYFQAYGKPPDPKVVAEQLEAYYESEAEAEYEMLSKSSKLSKKLGLGIKKKDEPVSPVKKGAAPTLGGRKLASEPAASTGEKKRYPNTPAGDRERLKDAVAWGEARKRSLDAARG